MSGKPKGSARSVRPKRGGTGRKPERRGKPAVTPARRAAYRILERVAQGGYVHESAHAVFANGELPREERAFALLIASGVVSTYGTLDRAIDAVLTDPDDIEFAVRQALYVAAFELLFLGKSPHACVDQGVELVRWVRPRAAGVANHVLRSLARQLDAWTTDLEERARVALERLEQARKDGDEAQEALQSGRFVEAAALRLGFPEWLAAELVRQRGAAWAWSFMRGANEPAPVFFLVNERKASLDQVAERLSQAGVPFVEVEEPWFVQARPAFPVLRLERRGHVSHPAFAQLLDEGAVVVADASAQAVASLSVPDAPPQRFLEVGSGRGGKTIMVQTAATLRHGAPLALETVELNPSRQQEADRRLAVANVPVARADVLDATDLSSLADGSFDAVLLDAPCSGAGTMRRHPEIRWSLEPADVDELAELELALLREAARKVAPGGMLTYATCSVLEQENEDVVRAFLETPEGAAFKPASVFRTPLGASDAPGVEPAADLHFACRLTRS